MSRRWSLFVIASLVGACGGERAAEEAADADTAPPAPSASVDSDTAAWTIGVVDVEPTMHAIPLPVLTDLRTATHPEYERLTLAVAGASSLPGYHLEYIDRPLHECGSGRQIHPVGDAWLEVRLEPAAAHTEEGRPTLGEREVAIEAPLLKRLYRTCDFEGVVTLVLALAAPNPFRVIELSDPARLVVDVQR